MPAEGQSEPTPTPTAGAGGAGLLPAPPDRPEDALSSAVWYARNMGWAVFPTVPNGKASATGKGGFKNASTDPAEIARMFAKAGASAGAAVSDGAPSGGLVVLDLDVHADRGEDGRETLRAYLEKNGLELPETAHAFTPSGGVHYYFTSPGGCGRHTGALPSIDLLGGDGYNLLPPSEIGGRRYQWAEGHAPWEVPIAPAPAWVLALAGAKDAEAPGGGKGAGKARRKAKGFALPETIPEGERNGTLYRYACSLRAKGADGAEIAEALGEANKERCAPPLTAAELEDIATSALERPQGPQGAIDELCGTLRGIPELSGARYNAFRNRVTVAGASWDPAEHEWGKADDAQLMRLLQSAAPIRPDGRGRKAVARPDAEAAFSIVTRERSFDVLTEFLEGLGPWDGKPRAALIPCEFLGAEPGYSGAVWHMLMCAAVERAYNPGAKFDTVPVLVGAQGIGKSTLLRRMACNPGWFLDNIADVNAKDTWQLMHDGKWVCELAELAGVRRKEVNAVKAFITRQVDEFRAVYEKHPMPHPRRFVLVGTANRGAFLEDPTGNRRFLPVQCGAVAPTLSPFDADAAQWMEQAWAEILYKRGHRDCGNRAEGTAWGLLLPERYAAQADAERAQWEEEDPYAGALEAFLEKCRPGTRVCAVMLAAEALGFPYPLPPQQRSVLKAVNAYMSNRAPMGWVRGGSPQVPANAARVKSLDGRTDYGPQKCYWALVAQEGAGQQQGNSWATDITAGSAA